MQLQGTDQPVDAGEPMTLQVIGNPPVDLLAHQRVVEQGRADAHRAGARDDELQCVLGRGDASLADDRDVVFATDLADLVHLQQRHRLDRRSYNFV